MFEYAVKIHSKKDDDASVSQTFQEFFNEFEQNCLRNSHNK